MSKGFKIKKILLSFVTVVSVIITIVTISWMALFHLYLVPKLGISRADIPTGEDVLQFTKYVINGKLADDIKNFDKETAKDVLGVMLELDEEITAEEIAAEGKKDNTNKDKTKEDNALDGQGKLDAKNIVPNSDVNELIKKSGVKVGKKQETAVDRIMRTATKEEINTGMAILAKIDLGTLSKLHAANDKKGISKYLLSKLTRKEINTGVALYNKYKHLL